MTKFFKLKGTSKRIEYWSVMVIGSIIIFVVTLDLLEILTTAESRIHQALGLTIVLGAMILTALWIQLATIVRRCRDSGISPWWSALVLIPYVGFVGLLVMGILPSKDSNDRDRMKNIKQKLDELEESFIKFQFKILKIFEFNETLEESFIKFKFKILKMFEFNETPNKYYRFKTDNNLLSEPFSENQLFKLFNDGKICSKTEIRCDGDSEWIEFCKVFPEKVQPSSEEISENFDPWTKTRFNDPQIRTKYNEREVKSYSRDVFDFIREIPHFIFLVIATLSYLMSIIKWFIKEHNTFLGAFLELIWALIPVINIIYVIDWWYIFFSIIVYFFIR